MFECNRYAELRYTVHEVARSVERINDPAPFVAFGAPRALLLTDELVVRICTENHVANRLFRPIVYKRNEVISLFGLNLRWIKAAEVFKQYARAGLCGLYRDVGKGHAVLLRGI